MAYILTEICCRDTSPAVDRAWAVLDDVFGKAAANDDRGLAVESPEQATRRTNVFRGPLLKLYQVAQHARR